MQGENESLKSQGSEQTTDLDETTTSEETSKAETQKLIQNNTVKVNNSYEITYLKYQFGQKITSSKPGRGYMYYEVKDKKNTYIDLTLSIKNLLPNGTMADEIASVIIKYDDTYEYKAFTALEEGDGSNLRSSYVDIAPLTTVLIHYLAEVPAEIAESTSSLIAIVNIDNTQYEIVLR